MKEIIAKILRIIAEILALVLIVVFLLRVIDARFPFISNIEVLSKIVSYFLTYGFLVLTALVGVSATLKINIILAIVVLVFVAVIAVFTFLPGVLDAIGI